MQTSAAQNAAALADPKYINIILITGIFHVAAKLECHPLAIQELSKTHGIVSRSKTELWHRIPTLYFREAERLHPSFLPDRFQAFLEKYPTPTMITNMSRDAFIANAWQVVRRKVSKERLLSDIYATAVNFFGLPVHSDFDIARMFRLGLAEGRSFIRQRN